MTSIEYIRRDNTYCKVGSRSFLLYDEAVRATAGTDVEPTEQPSQDVN